jgi:hypothetical protein
MKNVILALVAVMFTSCSVQGPKKSKNIDTTKQTNTTQTNSKGVKMVLVSTAYGDIKIRLYDETPLHRDNFVKLVESGFYNELLFHRVIQGFMIQGGDPNSKTASAGVALGSGGADMERIPAEFNPATSQKRSFSGGARWQSSKSFKCLPILHSSGKNLHRPRIGCFAIPPRHHLYRAAAE